MGKRKRSGSWSKGDECGSKKSDDGDSQEEMDGDCLTPKANTTNVRCSARVQEKQEKLRREASPSKTCSSESGCVEICSNGGGLPGIQCKGKVVSSSCEDVHLATDCGNDGVRSTNREIDQSKRKKRTWELWSQYDKQLFFEALNESGKDFDAIQSYLAAKLKSKNKTIEPTQIKKKEQVRHFYYRTWNKIQKYLRFPKDMKKAYQELYGLINYGELRKKQRVLNGKTAAKLLELVQKGSTTIKVKGKTQRIKTPVCQALKKINNLSDVEQTKVPTKVVVEFLPKDGGAWSVVQSLSHNPRVRSLVSLQRTLASMITYLEDRWKSSSDRIKEQMMTTFGKRSSRHLRVIPSRKHETSVPIYKTYETASSAKISLNSFSTNVLSKSKKDGCVKLTDKRQRTKSGSAIATDVAMDSHAEADWSDTEVSMENKNDSDIKDEIQDDLNQEENCHPVEAFQNSTKEELVDYTHEDEPYCSTPSTYEFCSLRRQEHNDTNNVSDSNPPDVVDLQSPNKLNDIKIDSLDIQHKVLSDGCNNIPVLIKPSDSANCTCSPSDDKLTEPEEVFTSVIDEEVLKKGWTALEAASLTVGEVYMMVGRNEKLSFEYEWDEGKEEQELKKRTKIMLGQLISVARNLKKKKQQRHKIISGGPGLSAGTCPGCGQPINVSVGAAPISGQLLDSIPKPVVTNSTPLANSSSGQHLGKTMASDASSTVILSTQNVPPSFSVLQTPIVPGQEGKEKCGVSPEVSGHITGRCSILRVKDSMNDGISKPKKIVPTLVSPSCSGKVLQAVTLAPKSDLKDNRASEDKFRVPSTGTSHLVRIRPATTIASGVDTDQVDDNQQSSVSKKVPPKPFLDLPKGNRRLGRPCCKKNIVPRYLPLIPKASDVVPQPPVWDLVSNKSPVHALYVGNAAQIMLPVAGITIQPALNAGFSVAVVNNNEKDQVTREELVKDSIKAPFDQSLPMSASKASLAPSSQEIRPLSATNDSLVQGEALSKNEFQRLIASSVASDKIDSNLSLSSFMDLSLPESTRDVANECLKDKFLDITLGSSDACSLGLSNFLSTSNASTHESSLVTNQNTKDRQETNPTKTAAFTNDISSLSNILTSDSHQWLNNESNEVSLGSLMLSSFETNASGANENELNFQSMIDDSNNRLQLDFTSKFNELVAELDSTNASTSKK